MSVPPPGGGVLRAEGVVVRFGGLVAVNGVSIEVSGGGMVGLIGPNGAGKTTLFNAISGFVLPQAGRVLLDASDLTPLPASARAALGLGRTFQRLELFWRMTVFDNLMVAAEAAHSRLDLASDLLQLPRRHREEERCREVVEEVLALTGLGWAGGRRAQDLPIGTARLVELARALCTRPRVLLLDEPSSGLDSTETQEVAAILRRVNRELGTSMLLVEHDVDLVLGLCQDVYVLDFGTLIAHGPPERVATDPAVREAYLGEAPEQPAAARHRRRRGGR